MILDKVFWNPNPYLFETNSNHSRTILKTASSDGIVMQSGQRQWRAGCICGAESISFKIDNVASISNLNLLSDGVALTLKSVRISVS